MKPHGIRVLNRYWINNSFCMKLSVSIKRRGIWGYMYLSKKESKGSCWTWQPIGIGHLHVAISGEMSIRYMYLLRGGRYR